MQQSIHLITHLLHGLPTDVDDVPDGRGVGYPIRKQSKRFSMHAPLPVRERYIYYTVWTVQGGVSIYIYATTLPVRYAMYICMQCEPYREGRLDIIGNACSPMLFFWYSLSQSAHVRSSDPESARYVALRLSGLDIYGV